MERRTNFGFCCRKDCAPTTTDDTGSLDPFDCEKYHHLVFFSYGAFDALHLRQAPAQQQGPGWISQCLHPEGVGVALLV